MLVFNNTIPDAVEEEQIALDRLPRFSPTVGSEFQLRGGHQHHNRTKECVAAAGKLANGHCYTPRKRLLEARRL
jgi:hypothetical protein